MLRRTEGVVLKSWPYGEADLIVTWLTKDFGIIKTFAKSPRKIKSRFGSSLEPLTHSLIAFWGKEDSALPRLTQSDIIHSFDSLRSGLECFIAISEMIELVLNLEPEGDRSGRAYELLIEALHSVEKCPPRDILILRFKLKLLEISGFLPHMESCGRCGSEGRHFYVDHGSVLCGNCAGREKRGVRVNAKWRMKKRRGYKRGTRPRRGTARPPCSRTVAAGREACPTAYGETPAVAAGTRRSGCCG